MRYFTSSRGIKFVFADYEDGTEVGAIQVATIGDLRELLTFIDEETRGPQLVRERPTLLLNGSGLDIAYDTTLPRGAIQFVIGGKRTVLMEGEKERNRFKRRHYNNCIVLRKRGRKAGGTDLTSTSPLSNAPEGGAGGGGEVPLRHQ